MEIYTTIIALLNVVMTFATGSLADVSSAMFSADHSLWSFSVQSATECTAESCPGSFYTAVTTAWANIGYVTHSDVLRFINKSNFGKWAILLYIGAAIGGLFGVATNAPMKNYTWFFLGPALFSFLVGSTMKVQGVNWVVANRAQEMDQVWRIAETGLANTRLVQDEELDINGKYGPTGQYEVAMPMVFLDELFSATANIMIEWTGIGRQVDNGGPESNLSKSPSRGEGRSTRDAWWLLSNLKWSYIENITASTARNPDVRDAFVTFLASECGDAFKKGINSGAYIAATQARGMNPVKTVFKGASGSEHDSQLMRTELGRLSIPTPRSLARLFKEKDDGNPGSFSNFSPILTDQPIKSGRGYGIVCSEYLWTLIQAFRFEAGNAYYQMIRSAPEGFDEGSFIDTILYGWDVRETEVQDIKPEEQIAFVKHLILAYILRNELISAPQITSVDQRYAPAEQARSYSDANIRNFGAKAKFIELYNAAVMMPHLQGILAYFLIIAYPIACMMVILPGHYKAFFTWVSFFAWIKLWDVGFAMVHVIERGVWAMLGNNSYMGGTARALIEVARKVGGIGVSPGGSLTPSSSGEELAALNALPIVCSLAKNKVDDKCTGAGVDQQLPEAMELFDKLLVIGSNIDLDLSNGWYIYIMSALYLAVPAVTGQLVLGAKAGSAGLIKDAFSAVGNDGGQAAKTGAQHQAVNALQTNQKSLGQAARAKALRKADAADAAGRSLAVQSMDVGNRASELGVENARLGGEKDFLHSKSSLGRNSLDSFSRGAGLFKAAYGGLDSTLGEKLLPSKTPGTDGNDAQTTRAGDVRRGINSLGDVAQSAKSLQLGRRMDNMAVDSAARGQDLGWTRSANDLRQGALKDQSGKLGSLAEFEADSAAWEAKNDFAAHASAMGGIAGMNAGNLSPNEKPQDTTQLAVSGNLDGYTSVPAGVASSRAAAVANRSNSGSNSAWYSAEKLPASINSMEKNGIATQGDNAIRSSWADGGGSYSAFGAALSAPSAVVQGENWLNSNDEAVIKKAGGDVKQFAFDKANQLPSFEKVQTAVSNWVDRADGVRGNNK